MMMFKPINREIHLTRRLSILAVLGCLVILTAKANHDIPFHSSALPEDRHTPTEKEIEATYQAIPDADRHAIDAWPAEQKQQYLIRRWLGDRKSFEAPPSLGAEPAKSADPGVELREHPDHDVPADRYVLDETLRKAYEAYVNTERPATVSRSLLEQYIEKEPASPFRAEVYYMLGSLSSTQRRDGEQTDVAEQIKWYAKAHEIYGRMYDHRNVAAWGTLANRAEGVTEQMNYYAWLLELRDHGTVESVYPIRGIGQTLNGRPPRITVDELTTVTKTMSRVLPNLLDTAARNMIHKATGDTATLIELRQTFPGTGLAEMIDKLLPARPEPPPVRLPVEATPVPGQADTDRPPRWQFPLRSLILPVIVSVTIVFLAIWAFSVHGRKR